MLSLFIFIFAVNTFIYWWNRFNSNGVGLQVVLFIWAWGVFILLYFFTTWGGFDNLKGLNYLAFWKKLIKLFILVCIFLSLIMYFKIRGWYDFYWWKWLYNTIYLNIIKSINIKIHAFSSLDSNFKRSQYKRQKPLKFISTVSILIKIIGLCLIVYLAICPHQIPIKIFLITLERWVILIVYLQIMMISLYKVWLSLYYKNINIFTLLVLFNWTVQTGLGDIIYINRSTYETYIISKGAFRVSFDDVHLSQDFFGAIPEPIETGRNISLDEEEVYERYGISLWWSNVKSYYIDKICYSNDWLFLLFLYWIELKFLKLISYIIRSTDIYNMVYYYDYKSNKEYENQLKRIL